jgi:hypothetical protein
MTSKLAEIKLACLGGFKEGRLLQLSRDRHKQASTSARAEAKREGVA